MTPQTPTLMVVHAHPDDESSQTGGTLACYAAAGWRTVLVTCTDGSQGDGADGVKPGQPGHRPQQVATQRARELDAAVGILGVCDLVALGYPDSGDGDPQPPPKAFSLRPLAPMAERLAELLRAYHPDIVITYPPNGLSGHPDHIRTHDLVRAALGMTAVATETAAAVVPQLYYIALSRSRLAALAAQARAELGPDGWSPSESMATDDAQITTAVDITDYWEVKLAALGAHASQSDAAALLTLFAAAGRREGARWFEEYVRADVSRSRETGSEISTDPRPQLGR